MLLFPEGLLILNETAHEIARRCDGRRSIRELLAELADEFEVDETVLRHDVCENLAQWQSRHLIHFPA